MFKIKKYLILLLAFFQLATIHSSQITIVGCGYVGLTMAALFSEVESDIVCFDVDKKKIEALRNHKTPIFEPGLGELLFDASTSHHLRFTDSLYESMQSQIFFVCVPTPSNDNGQCDCTYLFKSLSNILEYCAVKGEKIICVKSTVSPGTMKKLLEKIDESGRSDIRLIYNPEFMREGSALYDVRYRNPVVLSGSSIEALQVIEGMYRKMLSSSSSSAYINFIKTDYASAEVIKYAWNSFSAIRITYVNELAFLCRKLGANIYPVIQGLALSEELLPTSKLVPGPGYGGSCLPKDTRGFSKIIEYQGMQESLIHQAILSNVNHVKQLIEDICLQFDDLSQEKTVALLGLSFKANTNDIRNSAAIQIIDALQQRGISVKAFDPKAMSEMSGTYPDVTYCACPYEAATNADCIVALTEWDQIKHIDLGRMADVCRSKVLIDTRNLYDVKELKKHGYRYINMGRLL